MESHVVEAGAHALNTYRPRIPVALDYVAVLGRATYNFAYLEWGIVWLAETLHPGFVRKVGRLTAGEIAKEFDKFVRRSDPDAADRSRLERLAASFSALVVDRNALLHGRPYTGPGGEQRLLYNGKSGRRDWSVEDIVEAARSFENAALEAGDLLHGGRLKACQAAAG